MDEIVFLTYMVLFHLMALWAMFELQKVLLVSPTVDAWVARLQGSGIPVLYALSSKLRCPACVAWVCGLALCLTDLGIVTVARYVTIDKVIGLPLGALLGTGALVMMMRDHLAILRKAEAPRFAKTLIKDIEKVVQTALAPEKDLELEGVTLDETDSDNPVALVELSMLAAPDPVTLDNVLRKVRIALDDNFPNVDNVIYIDPFRPEHQAYLLYFESLEYFENKPEDETP